MKQVQVGSATVVPGQPQRPVNLLLRALWEAGYPARKEGHHGNC